ncbi:16S rRNA (adenine(1518)-N(6)/adenine(1519)-N(6))-dimethyltransferase RsmA [Caulobacter sp. KR2-114]|uniref:16S rRNA (adenine(1518)-N(6)/adenine(1519)-N(6))- dimethyltransferase RsmA n=1 Tax=Caulobacter sp. KR2-114 TaxID=3400912 RepID=UPI003C10C93B
MSAPAPPDGLDDLPPLRDVLAGAGLSADKRFGQHFLLDLNVTRKIVRLAQLGPDQPVIEVGPGPGGLTRALLEAGLRVIAVEKDPRFLPVLAQLAAAAPGRLTVVEADALAVDEAALAGGGPASIVSNLPYNVGTPLLVKWLTGAFRPVSMTLMFQKEVADRIAAPPGGRDYGRLGVLAQALCHAEKVMDLPARAFTPPPKVASAVVRLTPLAEPPPAALVDALQTVTAAAFGQRRKMLRSSLKVLGGEALCEAAGLDPNARAETVPVAGFLRLAAVMGKR